MLMKTHLITVRGYAIYIHGLVVHLVPELTQMITQWNKGSLSFQHQHECSTLYLRVFCYERF